MLAEPSMAAQSGDGLNFDRRWLAAGLVVGCATCGGLILYGGILWAYANRHAHEILTMSGVVRPIAYACWGVAGLLGSLLLFGWIRSSRSALGAAGVGFVLLGALTLIVLPDFSAGAVSLIVGSIGSGAALLHSLRRIPGRGDTIEG